ncbi:hypothetical protein C480_16724 [Natrialba aegyptia DSM 13077]|uniref:Uncharacterized protein n=2 Tax=Natrialba aegyptia TaxID=129789 RepID=M0AWN9_9EURY|nr:hypothetical protein C480_16724 [Natrialba aegyptia DSM 13077]
MMSLHFREATDVYRKTWPFVLLQLAIGIAFALLGVIYLALVVWLGSLFLWGDGGGGILVVALVMLVALVSFAYIWRLIKRYVLYMVNAGHVAVIAHIVEEGEVPENQLSYGTTQVQEYFVSASGLYGVNVLVDAILKQFTRSIARVQELIPLPIPSELEALIDVLQKSIVLAVRYLDTAILAYMFVDRNDNRWASARDGVVLYGKTWKTVLGSTLLIVVGMYALSFVLATLLAPVAVALDVLPPAFELLSWVLVAGVVAVVHAGVVKPWVKTVVITTFLVEQREETTDSETMSWIEDRSDRFSELVEKAENDAPVDDDHPDAGRTPTPGEAA